MTSRRAACEVATRRLASMLHIVAGFGFVTFDAEDAADQLSEMKFVRFNIGGDKQVCLSCVLKCRVVCLPLVLSLRF
jgi:hypothetical protein